MTVSEAKREDVLPYGTRTTHHRQLADVSELVDNNATRHERPVSDRHMAGQGHAIPHHHTVADDALMRHVRCCHQHAISPDPRDAPRLDTTMDSDVLADDSAVADCDAALTTRELQVLREPSQNGSYLDRHILSHRGSRQKNGVVTYPGTRSDDDTRLDHSSGCNDDILG